MGVPPVWLARNRTLSIAGPDIVPDGMSR